MYRSNITGCLEEIVFSPSEGQICVKPLVCSDHLQHPLTLSIPPPFIQPGSGFVVSQRWHLLHKKRTCREMGLLCLMRLVHYQHDLQTLSRHSHYFWRCSGTPYSRYLKVTFAAKYRLPETITRSLNHDGQMEDQDSEAVVVEDQAEQEVEAGGGLEPLMISEAVCSVYVLWLIISWMRTM